MVDVCRGDMLKNDVFYLTNLQFSEPVASGTSLDTFALTTFSVIYSKSKEKTVLSQAQFSVFKPL